MHFRTLLSTFAKVAVMVVVGTVVAVQSVSAATTNLHVMLDAQSSMVRTVSLGSVGQTLGVWNFRADGDSAVLISRLDVVNRNHAGDVNIKNLSLWVNGIRVSTVVPSINGTVRFDSLSLTVPRGGIVVITLKGDITSASSGGVPGLVQMSIATPAKITGVASDSIIATTVSTHGGRYVTMPGAATYNANLINVTR